MNLVIVESPAKAETIQKYLGRGYKVLASFGHTLDLPAKPGSVEPERQFLMHYEPIAKAQKNLQKIYNEAAKAQMIYLATDPDREGEVIAWHIAQQLTQRKIVKSDLPIKRITFNEITKEAVLGSLKSARELDFNLVNAQQARRALDYLVGFTLSPVLWRKLPGCKSAGRVQSVALRLVCNRAHEVANFDTQEYWDITANFITNLGEIVAKLVTYAKQKLDKFSIASKEEAEKLAAELQNTQFKVSVVSTKQQKRKPPTPFITSTLQQEGVNKLGFSVKRIMSIAQQLYEGVEIDGEKHGLITYMRTDGVNLSKEAITQLRSFIEHEYGPSYLPASPKIYRSKQKNAQEAHEAIRPTNIKLTPEALKDKLSTEHYRVYNLVWRRTMASQMTDAVIENVTVKIESTDSNSIMQANGSIIRFDGFYKVYREEIDKKIDEGELLLSLQEGQMLNLKAITPEQHFTEPPPQYNEASLVKKLEELGIGRPSTYAAIPTVLQERGYMNLDKKRFVPAERGQIVTAFLEHFFAKYVDYNFTAELEDNLDNIAAGKLEWKKLMHEFWQGFDADVKQIQDYKISQVIEVLNETLGDYLFPKDEKGNISRQCQVCDGVLSLKLSKFGGFIACSNYPTCNFSKALTTQQSEGEQPSTASTGQLVGQWQQQDIYLKKGPYGWYLETQLLKSKKPKRISLPANHQPEHITSDIAENLISLPRVIGVDPQSVKEITLNIGRFGPYLQCGDIRASVKSGIDPFTISLEQAVNIISAKNNSPNKTWSSRKKSSKESDKK